jgi:hypothetical protein
VTKALKFLRPERVAPFAGVAWPEPPSWLEGEPEPVHALLPEGLAPWIAEELWRVELEGAEEIVPGILAAPRGRLVARVEEWDDAAAREFARACAAHASEGATGRSAEYAADAVEAASEAVAGPSATLVGYMAAHAVEAAAPGSFTAERRRQSLWLSERLGLLADTH